MPSSREARLGEIWDVNFDPRVGREQGGIRPALIISNDYFNRAPNGLYIIVPITGTDRHIRYHVNVDPPEGGLTKPSVIMCDQVRAQSVKRLIRRRGEVSSEIVETVQSMITEFFNL